MTEREQKIKDIKSAEMLILCGYNPNLINPPEVRKMMKKIAANAVIIGFFNFNGYVISNICDGNFNTIKKEEYWKYIKNDLIRCLAIIDNEGENLKDILTSEEIKEAVKYTIFEEAGESKEDE